MSAVPLESPSSESRNLQRFAIPPTGVQPQAVASSGPSAGQHPDVLLARDAWGLFGEGQTVVVIDSGIAYDHPALGGGFGSGMRVVGGWDFAEGDSNPYDDLPGGLHGTHVAGIIGSADANYPGIAPEVDLVALRIFDDAGMGGFERIEAALQWVLRNRNTFEHPISVVNISIGSDWNGTAPPQWATMEDELAQIAASGILVTASAGNAFASYGEAGLSYPAASSSVLPVGAFDQNGSLSAYSQRHARMIAAPGDGIVSTVPDFAFDFNGRTDDFMALSGTSMAAPFMAGASVLVREAIERAQGRIPRADELQQIFRQTSRRVWDTVTRAYYEHVDLASALRSVIPQDESTGPHDSRQLGGLIGTTTIAGVIQNDTDADFVTFQATRTGTMVVDIGWNSIADQQPSLFVQDRNGHLVRMTDGLQVEAGRNYHFAVMSGGGIGRYLLNLGYAVGGPAAPQTPFSSTIGAAESRIQWTAGVTGQVTVNLDFANPTSIDHFSIRNLRTSAIVASIRDPGVHEVLALPVVAGDRFEFTVQGRGIDANLSIQRGSTASGGVGPTILATRLSHGNQVEGSIDAAFRDVVTKPSQDTKTRPHEIDTHSTDEWMAVADQELAVCSQSGMQKLATTSKASSTFPIITVSDQEPAAVNAAFDTLATWYRDDLGRFFGGDKVGVDGV